MRDLRRRIDPATEGDRIRRLLVCVRYGIGDVVMELPVLEALRRAVPDAHITVLGAFPATQLLERHPAVNAVAALQDWGFIHRWDPGPLSGCQAVSAWLDAQDFDVVLNSTNVTPGFTRHLRGRRLRTLDTSVETERAAVRRGEHGVFAIQEGARTGWGIDIPGGATPRIEPSTESRRSAARFLLRHGIHDRRPVAVSPVASLELKRWPITHLAQLADELLREPDEKLLIFDGTDAEVGESLDRAMAHDERVVRVPEMHLLRVAALLECCQLLVCNDTGLMHIAAAVGTPTVAVFGPTPPSSFLPPVDHVASADASSVECAHRVTGSLRPPRCITEGRCLQDHGPCIARVPMARVLGAVRTLRSRGTSDPG